MNRKSFWIILASVHALFFLKQVLVYNSLLQDSVEYLFAADNLMQKGTLYAWNLNFAFNADWLTKRPFLYPSILIAFKSISFQSNTLFFILIYLAQNLISLNNIRLSLKLADRFNPGFSHLKALLFMLLSLSQVIYANLIMCEIWLQACFIGITYILLTHPNGNRKFLYIALLMMAAMALKPVFMPAAILFPILMILAFRKQLKVSYLSIALLPLLFAQISSVINEKRTGYRQYSSISTINLIHYNTYIMLMSEYGTQKADSLVDDIKLRTRGMSYADRQEFITDECKTLIKQHLGRYTYLHLRGIAFALADPGRFDFTQFFNLAHKGNLIYQTNQKGMLGKVLQSFLNPLGLWLMLILLFNLFRVYKAIDFLFQKRYAWPFKLLIMAIPTYILALTGPIGTSRFFMPLVPIALLVFLLSLRPQSK